MKRGTTRSNVYDKVVTVVRKVVGRLRRCLDDVGAEPRDAASSLVGSHGHGAFANGIVRLAGQHRPDAGSHLIKKLWIEESNLGDYQLIQFIREKSRLCASVRSLWIAAGPLRIDALYYKDSIFVVVIKHRVRSENHPTSFDIRVLINPNFTAENKFRGARSNPYTPAYEQRHLVSLKTLCIRATLIV